MILMELITHRFYQQNKLLESISSDPKLLLYENMNLNFIENKYMVEKTIILI